MEEGSEPDELITVLYCIYVVTDTAVNKNAVILQELNRIGFKTCVLQGVQEVEES